MTTRPVGSRTHGHRGDSSESELPEDAEREHEKSRASARPSARPRLGLSIGAKFFVVLAVFGPLILAVALVGASGLGAMKRETDRIFKDTTDLIRTSGVTSKLGRDLARTDQLARQLVATHDVNRRQALKAELDETGVPAVESDIASLRGLHAADNAAERVPVDQLEAGWRQFLKLRQGGVLAATSGRETRASGAALAAKISEIFAPLTVLTDKLVHVEAVHAGQAHARSVHTYATNHTLIIVIALGALLLGVGSVLVLIRSIVPRVKSYARFATRVAAGDLSSRLRPRGADELAQLGVALNEMVERRAASAAHDDGQAEFMDTLQVTETEDEAHELLKRQLERTVADSSVVVLNRNNSADRLEATTTVPESSAIVEGLADAKPRSCLAVRFARPHHEAPGGEPLINCELCGKTGQRSTCEPLLVGGEVIGSVLVEHSAALGDDGTRAIRESVSQAAPVLANLRNLAIAEVRAATDALTGLPNDRAVRDTIKRMVAQASRAVSPLSAVMLDLDHFKQINDTFGHDRGDDVLAAVGSALQATVRESDFVGRQGGEEFVLLLPATGLDQAALVAEKVRAAIAHITVPGVERTITASLGVAELPAHAGDADGLMRAADRALYTAKGNGRNRVELAAQRAGAGSVTGQTR